MTPIELMEEGTPSEVLALARALRQRMRGKIIVQPVDFILGADQPGRHWAIKVVVSHQQGVLVWYVPSSRQVSLQLHDQTLEPRCELGRYDERRLSPMVAAIVRALHADWRLAA